MMKQRRQVNQREKGRTARREAGEGERDKMKREVSLGKASQYYLCTCEARS